MLKISKVRKSRGCERYEFSLCIFNLKKNGQFPNSVPDVPVGDQQHQDGARVRRKEEVK